MSRRSKTNHRLFTLAEQQIKTAHSGSERRLTGHMKGLVCPKEISKELERLKELSVDGYISRVLDLAESASLPSAKTVLRMINGKVFNEIDMGPLYAVEIALESESGQRHLGFIAQNRAIRNGIWSPEHHREAARIVRSLNRRNLPIVTLIDTPGADAGAEANARNQAHSISRLIAEMTNAHVPTLGIIYGLGYSGGAIPLAATNLLLSLRTGVFNTIQPKGLASIARQYNLSWQESARHVGIAPAELRMRGAIDGIIDWAPPDIAYGTSPLIEAIVSGIEAVEAACQTIVVEEPGILADYQRSLQRHLEQDKITQKRQRQVDFASPGICTEFANPFGHACRHLRYLALRNRIKSSTTDAYGRLAQEEMPCGDLQERQKKAQEISFEKWRQNAEKLVYQEDLSQAWRNLREKYNELSIDRGRFTTLLLGDPQRNFDHARQKFCFRVTLYLYNRWKTDNRHHFARIWEMLKNVGKETETETEEFYALNETNLTLTDLLLAPSLKDSFLQQFSNILIFDRIYDNIVSNLSEIAAETREFHTLSADSLKKILDKAVEEASTHVSNHRPEKFSTGDFARWLGYFVRHPKRGTFLKDVEEWKRISFPRLSESLLVLITFFFENLVPEYLNSHLYGKPYVGHINPVRIGKRKDFWNQLNIAYRDLLVQKVLRTYKRGNTTTAKTFRETFFSEFEETDAQRMTADPVSFPGFRLSIEKAIKAGIKPCGLITGIARLKSIADHPCVGTVISNVDFQAGAFDMASAEKMCALLEECTLRQLPLVCFISSGGMQTKEGANALFSMAIVNERITRFILETGLPVIVFGFGDCTGGSQASFVTHPLVHTYYFSGTDLPFAGRLVVPSFLPSMYTVSNYLAKTPGAMAGLVKHPFAKGMDEELASIDAEIELPSRTVENVLGELLGKHPSDDEDKKIEPVIAEGEQRGAIDKVLIHARGCTAVKLIRIAQKLNKKILLVQSDPDMDSVPAGMMREGVDEAVSLGGQTPDESYLNAHSVLAIAHRYGVDALHPGIGFLSENAEFARLCRMHRLNFIGPNAQSMDIMGNKSNAIKTAIENNVQVVPGSHGILTTTAAAARIAEEIGYPVLLKAVYGGGGKGIRMAREPGEIADAFNHVFSEAKSAFGNGDLYLEKIVESMRHIEVQILRDTHGHTKVLGLRDCSVQRNNQKILEESASTLLPEKFEKDLFRRATDLANAVNYIGAGTVEFIYDLNAQACYFMEMNTRLQVEHPVTEWVSGVSIVAEQFRIAEGQSIENLAIENRGFSIEARITAERCRIDANGTFDFIPTPGQIRECYFPQRKDMELICAVDEGKNVSPFYDSMIAQLIVHGENRNDAISRLTDILDKVRIKGVSTNIPLLKIILQDEIFLSGNYDTRYLPGLLERIDPQSLSEAMSRSAESATDQCIDTLRIEDSDEIKVLSPISGIFYNASSPNEPEYVTPGSHIRLSTTLCQIEAMKLFSPISLSSVQGANNIFAADSVYEIVQSHQSGGTQVNAGDLLFVVKPA